MVHFLANCFPLWSILVPDDDQGVDVETIWLLSSPCLVSTLETFDPNDQYQTLKWRHLQGRKTKMVAFKAAFLKRVGMLIASRGGLGQNNSGKNWEEGNGHHCRRSKIRFALICCSSKHHANDGARWPPSRPGRSTFVIVACVGNKKAFMKLAFYTLLKIVLTVSGAKSRMPRRLLYVALGSSFSCSSQLPWRPSFIVTHHGDILRFDMLHCLEHTIMGGVESGRLLSWYRLCAFFFTRSKCARSLLPEILRVSHVPEIE